MTKIPKKLRTSQCSLNSRSKLWWKEEKKRVQEEAMEAFRKGEHYESMYYADRKRLRDWIPEYKRERLEKLNEYIRKREEEVRGK